jgi:hypothetical protein
MNPSPEVSLERDDSRLPPRIEAVALASPEPVTAPDLAGAPSGPTNWRSGWRLTA